MSAGTNAAAMPVAPGERQTLLDVLRGISLLGILMVNMQFFAAANGYDLDRFDGWLDRSVQWLILFVAQGKFYLLFSLLFGYGLAVQLGRAAGKDRAFARRYGRRLGGLFALGLVHGLLFFVGDILLPYAILGFVLFRFRHATPERLLRWAGGLVAAGLILIIAAGALFAGEIEAATATTASPAAVDGGWLAHSGERVVTLGETYLFLAVLQWPSALAMFLLGLYAGQRGVFAHPGEHRALFWTLLRWGAPIGLAGAAVTATTGIMGGDSDAVSILAETATAPALTLAYVAAVALPMGQVAWRRRLAFLEVLGRMSLTNYLVQSLVCSTIYAGYGFGLHDRLGPAAGLGLTLVIWLGQIPFSRWWLDRFRFGPAEWLLRSVTYGRWQPLRGTDSVGGAPDRGAG